MKKHFIYTILAFYCLGMGFTACSDDDNEIKPLEVDNGNFIFLKLWNGKSPEEDKSRTLTITSGNGGYKLTPKDEVSELPFDYEIKDNSIKFTPKKVSEQVLMILTDKEGQRTEIGVVVDYDYLILEVNALKATVVADASIKAVIENTIVSKSTLQAGNICMLTDDTKTLSVSIHKDMRAALNPATPPIKKGTFALDKDAPYLAFDYKSEKENYLLKGAPYIVLYWYFGIVPNWTGGRETGPTMQYLLLDLTEEYKTKYPEVNVESVILEVVTIYRNSKYIY